jgi:hypothetical protein
VPNTCVRLYVFKRIFKNFDIRPCCTVGHHSRLAALSSLTLSFQAQITQLCIHLPNNRSCYKLLEIQTHLDIGQFFALLCLCLFLVPFESHGQEQKLVRNGSFEQITVVPGLSTRANPWGPGIAFSVGFENTPDGRNYAGFGIAYQDIFTQPGQVYSLSFWAASDYADRREDNTGWILVRWNNEDAATFATEPHPYDNTKSARSDQIVWEQFQLSPLVAVSGSTRLEFQSINESAMQLDDVRLQIIPEPGSAALLIVGLGLVWRRLQRGAVLISRPRRSVASRPSPSRWLR